MINLGWHERVNCEKLTGEVSSKSRSGRSERLKVEVPFLKSPFPPLARRSRRAL